MSEQWETLGGGEPAADHQYAVPVAPSAPRPTGLREAREATGLHIAALAAALKVPVKKLEALEAGRYEELPDLTFARALAASACRHLKIDPAGVLSLFPQAHSPVLDLRGERDNAPIRSPMPSMSWAWLADLKKPPFVIAALALVGAGLLAFVPDWSQWPGKTLWDDARQAMQGSGTAPADESADAQPKSGDETPAPASAEGAAEPAMAKSDAANVSTPALKSASNLAEEGGAATSAALLRLEAVENSWIEVLDGSGKVQVQRMLTKGDSLDFSTNPPYAVVLGRADAVKVTVRGQPFDVTPFARNSVARFPVK